MDKVCRRCGESKPLADYYPHRQMADGHLNSCKVCVIARVRERYAATRTERAAYERRRQRDPSRRAKKYTYLRELRRRCPEKARAWCKTHYALRTGRLKRQPCRFCGKAKAQAHHDDYSKPLDVKWECFKCHREREHGQVVVSDF